MYFLAAFTAPFIVGLSAVAETLVVFAPVLKAISDSKKPVSIVFKSATRGFLNFLNFLRTLKPSFLINGVPISIMSIYFFVISAILIAFFISISKANCSFI